MSEIKRNRFDQPLIAPPGGGKVTPYQRVSKFAKLIDDPFKLCEWQQKATALGVIKSPDLTNQVRQIWADYPDPINEKEAKDRLQPIIGQAKKIAGSEKAAERGTDLHGYTDVIDSTGDLPPDLDDNTQARLIEYMNATAGMGVLAIEQFIVNDTYKTAGTFDRLLRLPDGRVVVGDLKTGSWDARYPLGVVMQIAQYASGNTVDPETWERGPVHPDLDATMGVLIHLPNRGEGCHLYRLDLTVGYELLDTAVRLRAARKIPARNICVPL